MVGIQVFDQLFVVTPVTNYMLILEKGFNKVWDVYFKHTGLTRHIYVVFSVLEVFTVILGWLHVPMVGQLWVTNAYGGEVVGYGCLWWGK